LSACLEIVPEVEPAPPAPRGCQFIPLDEAARRSGRVIGHLARECRKPGGWQSRQLARLQTPEGGGKKQWYVREDADTSFARVPMPEHKAIDPAALTARQQDILTTRRKLLAEWQAAIARRLPGVTKLQASKQFCELAGAIDGRKISPRTLELWEKSYRTDGPVGLLDDRVTRGTAAEADRGDDPFLTFVRDLYLTPNALKLAYCHYIASERAKQTGWTICSYKSCQRFIKKLPRQLVILKREGKKAFEDKCEPAITRDYSTLASNDIWCADDHTFDVAVRVMIDGKEKHIRPTVTAWEDLSSRKYVAWAVIGHSANTDTVLRTFRAGAIEHGLPGKILVDNGKHYDNRNITGLTKKQRQTHRELLRKGETPPKLDRHRLEGAFGILEVAVQYARKYHGQSKPIERSFGTVCDRFSRLWTTYTGNSPTNKPENLAKRIAAGQAPTLEEFTEAFNEWVTVYYNAAHEHHGDAMNGRTPDQAYAENFTNSPRRPADELLMFATLPTVGPVKVGKQGVTWLGMNFGAFDAPVQKLYGQRVLLKIADEVARGVLVLNMDGSLNCVARPNLKISFDATPQDIRDAHAEKGKLRKSLRSYQNVRGKLSHDTHDLVRAAATRTATTKRVESREVAPPPPSLRLHRTSFEDQLPVIRKALDRNDASAAADSIDLNQFRPRAPLPAPAPPAEDDLDVFAALSDSMRRTPMKFCQEDTDE
jgi:putative transposase